LQFSANQPILNSGQGHLILRRKVASYFPAQNWKPRTH
jgi:hypothetical protein